MGRDAPSDSQNGSGRESRLKLVLLAVTLFLVAGYALWVTNLGGTILSLAGQVFGSLPIMQLAMGGAALAIIASAVLFVRRRWAARPKSAVVEVTGGSGGLNGRAAFLKTLATRIDAHGKSGRQLALHLIDIDGFRTVNDLLGEEEGDAFLRLVAERLLVLVNHADRLARIGDDEFAIIQPEVGGARHAEIYVRRIQETLKDVCAQLPRHARPSASIGIAVYPEHGDDAGKLVHTASLAQHAAKRAGGDTFQVYSRGMDIAVDTRRETETAISDGLQKGWFALHYQPQYDLITRRLTGFEALVRMNHPERGELPPGDFLPVADESGLIQPLGEWIIKDAFATASNWPKHTTLALNVSVAQLRHGDIAGSIISMLSSSGFDGKRLRVEVPEAALVDWSSAVADQLRRLKTRGVTVVVDGFGLENSRLKSLSRDVCDAVKIHQSLLQTVGADKEAEALARGLIGTAKAFGLDVHAQGVEHVEQAHFLIANDCHKVQGFLFGRPAPVEDLAAIIAKDTRKASDAGQGSARASRSAA